MTVQGRGKPLKCWKTIGHGPQTLTQAAQHSCNVAFATLGLRIGEETFYRYCESFGFFRASENPDASLTGKTGISLPGESGSIWWPRSVFCNSENFSQLAAASFGQTFNITPLQLITAVSACCNGGYLMKPYIVDSVTDGTGALISKTEPEVLRQVISEKTSAQVNAVLEQVVCDTKQGTGKNAYVAGYHIAGKTGTSEKVAQDAAGGKKEYIVSFIGYAPADDPQVVCLVLMDTPSNESGIYISGGQMAAPVVGRILGEVLPYLGVQPQYSEAEEKYIDRAVPPLTGKTPEEAVKLLREAGSPPGSKEPATLSPASCRGRERSLRAAQRCSSIPVKYRRQKRRPCRSLRGSPIPRRGKRSFHEGCSSARTARSSPTAIRCALCSRAPARGRAFLRAA